MIKTLFQTGPRVSEFVQIRVENLLLDRDPPQIHIVHAKRGADCYVPVLSALAARKVLKLGRCYSDLTARSVATSERQRKRSLTDEKVLIGYRSRPSSSERT
jgi:site-specific recombinase XerD